MSASIWRRYKWWWAATIGLVVCYGLLKTYQADLNTNLNMEADQSSAVGASYGLNHNQQACMDKSLRDIQGCNSFACGVLAGRFIKACLENAPSSVGFCEDVPAFTVEKDRDTKEWLRDICFEQPETNTCYLVRRQQQQICSS